MSRKGNDNDRYVVPSQRGGWNVVREQHKRASGYFSTKQQAIDRGRETARNAGGELRIANREGRFIDSDTVAPGHESPKRDTK